MREEGKDEKEREIGRGRDKGCEREGVGKGETGSEGVRKGEER